MPLSPPLIASTTTSSRRRRRQRRNCFSTHVPTSSVQRGLLTAVSAVTALIDPSRADMVAALGETTGTGALETLRTRMLAHPVGINILKQKLNLTEKTLCLNSLRKLPTGSFGRAYVDWMDQYGYSPDERPEVRYIEDEELAYIMQRYRQTHDFSHVLLNLPPTGINIFEADYSRYYYLLLIILLFIQLTYN